MTAPVRTFASLILAILWSTFAECGQDRPNILILMAEDMGARVGAFGDDVATSPNLDAFAASGVRFPNTFTTAGVCAPSRAAHITGMHQVSIGAQHMRTSSYPDGAYLAVPPPAVKAYPELLRRAGYYTLTNHKLDYQFSTYGAGTGPFTIWDHEGEGADWNLRAEGQPFFALINFGMTHESRMFAKNVLVQRERGWKQVTGSRDVEVPPYYPDTPVIRQDIAQHYDNIREMDREVGLWLQKLVDDGLADDTIVMWTTDHGDGLPRAKREVYDSGIRVPMIVYWPDRFRPEGADSGSEDGRLVSFVDFGPSVLAWAGVEIPDFMHGRPLLTDPDLERDYIYASKDRLDEMPFRERAVRDRRFKYIRNFRPGEPGGKPLAYREQLATMQELHRWFESGRMNDAQAFWFRPRPAEELYDIEADPHEVNNLVADPAFTGVLERMRDAYADWRGRVPDWSDRPEAEMAERFWPGGEQPLTAAPIISVENGWVSIASSTPGASVGYRLGDGEWKIYADPLEVNEGMVIEAKAVRYGWKESGPVRWPAADYTAVVDSEFIMLSDGERLNVAVSPEHGGELAGFELYFQGEWHELIYRAKDYTHTDGWRGKAPFLWPAVGITLHPDGEDRGFSVDGQFYPMPPHGFARDGAWTLHDHGAGEDGAFATLTLASDADTQTHYPFDFTLSVDYRLAGGRLSITYTVQAGADNTGAMPFSIGNHVTFKAPLIEGAIPGAVVFRNDFPSQLIRAADRTFSGEVVASPYRGEQPLSALPRRQAVSLGGGDGLAELIVADPSGLTIHLSHEASKMPAEPAILFNLWADTEEGFFSPEPWIGVQNSLNNGAGLVRLEPGEDWRWTIEITPGGLEPPGTSE